MTASTIAERVAAGAMWLDENRPGWVERIDLDTLDLGDPCCCVLGQEYGTFSDAWIRGDGDWQIWSANRGFYAEIQCQYAYTAEASEAEYEALTAEWRRLIVARRVLTS